MAQSVQIKKVSPWQERLADELLINPTATGAELAKKFKVTEPWISSVKNSDVFQDYFRARSKELSNALITTVVDKARALAEITIDKLTDKVMKEALPAGELLDIADVMMKRAGYATDAKAAPPQINQNNFFGHVTKEDLAESRALMRGKLPQVGGPSSIEEAVTIEAESLTVVGGA